MVISNILFIFAAFIKIIYIMTKKEIIKGVLTILAAAIAAALSFFFASCTSSAHLELKHSNDSLIIRKDGSMSITKIMYQPSNSFLIYLSN